MATFFTRIILDEIKKTRRNFFEGEFVIDVEELNVFKRFNFIVEYRHARYHSIFIYRDGKVFLRQTASSSVEKYTKEQLAVLTAFEVVFSAYKGTLNTKRFALTKVERGQKLSVSTPTPDSMRIVLIKACCL